MLGKATAARIQVGGSCCLLAADGLMIWNCARDDDDDVGNF